MTPSAPSCRPASLSAGRNAERTLTRFLLASLLVHGTVWGAAAGRAKPSPPPPEARAVLRVRGADGDVPPDFMMYVTPAEMMRNAEEQLMKGFEETAPKVDRSKDPENILLSELTDAPPEPAAAPEVKAERSPPKPKPAAKEAAPPPAAPKPNPKAEAKAAEEAARARKTEAAELAARQAVAQAEQDARNAQAAATMNQARAAEAPPPAAPETAEAHAAPEETHKEPGAEAAPAQNPSPPEAGKAAGDASAETSFAPQGAGDFGAIYAYGVTPVQADGARPPAAPADSAPARRRYEQLLTAWISKFQRPMAGDMHGEGILLFGVTRKGSVSASSLNRSTGNPVLDEAALRMIQDASPVIPPPPDYMPEEAVIYFAVPFRF